MEVLGGKAHFHTSGRRNMDFIQERIRQHQAQIDAYLDLCEKLKEEPAVVALAWLLANPAVTARIVGPRTEEELDSVLRAVNLSFRKMQ